MLGAESYPPPMMEAKKHALGIWSATSATTTATIKEDPNLREDIIIDANTHAGDDSLPSSEAQDERDDYYGDSSPVLRLLGNFFLAFMFAAIILSSAISLRPSRKIHSNILGDHHASENGEEGIIGIKLHPEHFVSRVPKTIIHDWNVTSDFRSPDGVKKQVYLVNGRFPGPTIECRSGDHLIIHVTNSLPSGQSVSIHWHGLYMRKQNNMDGAVGFTQCPIPSGESFKYEFDVDENQSGTFWWHAHSQVQRGDGLYGGLIVHDPNREVLTGKVNGPHKEILLLIGDWYHRSAEEVLGWYTSVRGFGNEPVPDSLIINGAGRFICSMAVPARPVDCTDFKPEDILPIIPKTQRHEQIRLRIVNTGTLAGFTMGISGFFTPLTVDGDFSIRAKPSMSVGVLYPGERMDILLHPDLSEVNKSSQLDIYLDPENFKYPNPSLSLNQSFPLIINGQSSGDIIGQLDIANSRHFNLSSALALKPDSAPKLLSESPQETILLYTKTEKLSKLSNRPTSFINRTSWATQSEPSLPLISLPRHSWDKNQLVPWIPRSQGFVEVIVNNLDDGAHPLHLHGNDFYVVASHRSEHGWGSYSLYQSSGTASIPPTLNLRNPVRKDTVSVPRRGYVILRLRPDNPGIWMFHCHVLFHQASGMAMGFAIGGDEQHGDVDLTTQSLCG